MCDASAKTMSGVSLNDCLLAGPSLYPKLSAVLLKFRLWDIAYSADVAKMFQEVSLAPSERDFHQFLARDDDGHITDYRMSRVTFGVKSSPFLASAVLRKGAIDNANSHPTATLVDKQFYVNDFLWGSNSLEDVIHVQQDLTALLAEFGMTLRKWRTNRTELRDVIPGDLWETEPLHFRANAEGCPKALGIH